jgi:hypothetical protein
MAVMRRKNKVARDFYTKARPRYHLARAAALFRTAPRLHVSLLPSSPGLGLSLSRRGVANDATLRARPARHGLRLHYGSATAPTPGGLTLGAPAAANGHDSAPYFYVLAGAARWSYSSSS